MIERRKHIRMKVMLPVRLHMGEGQILPADIEDISVGGARVRCPHPLEVGQSITLEIRFAGLRLLAGTVKEIEGVEGKAPPTAQESAIIRWEKGSKLYGVEFQGLRAESRLFLNQLVKYFEQVGKLTPGAEEEE